jgi:hypothetical protein
MTKVTHENALFVLSGIAWKTLVRNRDRVGCQAEAGFTFSAWPDVRLALIQGSRPKPARK